MTKTFKRTGQSDINSKKYRTYGKKAFRTHFRTNVNNADFDGYDDNLYPEIRSTHHVKLSYVPNIDGFHPKDIVGDSSVMKRNKERFYNNTRQSKFIVETNYIDSDVYGIVEKEEGEMPDIKKKWELSVFEAIMDELYFYCVDLEDNGTVEEKTSMNHFLDKLIETLKQTN